MNGAAPARILAIVGPTAVGKSALGIRLAEELDGEIINADALQVYRGFDIGTDKPSGELRRKTPHHLIDILDPSERFSAGEFARRARAAIAQIERRGKTAIVVGGSGLYLRALLDGMIPIPSTAPAVRESLEQRLREEGLATLRRELDRIDPECPERCRRCSRRGRRKRCS